MLRPITLLIILLLTRPAFAQQQPTPTDSIVDAVVAAIHLIDQRHIDPPTKQEMLKRVITKIRQGNATWVPSQTGVASLASGLVTDEQFRQALTREIETNQGTITRLGDDPILAILSALEVPVQPLKEARVQKQIQANRYVGIGIAISSRDGITRMAKVLPGGPAEKGGAKDNDQINAVDNKPTKDIPLKTVVDWLRGEKGTAVNVQLKRGEQLIDLELVRNVVPMKTVFVQFKDTSGRSLNSVQRRLGSVERIIIGRVHQEGRFDPAKQIAVISFGAIGASTVHELREIEQEAIDRKIVGVILDLRINGTPSPLHETKLLADALIANQSLGSQLTRNSDVAFNAGPTQMFDGLRMAVLINGAVEGPNEWLAAALQKSGATLFGLPTAGHALAVKSFAIPNADYSLTIPAGILRSPDGNILYRKVTQSPIMQPVATTARTTVRRTTATAQRQPGRVYPDVSHNGTIDPSALAIAHINQMLSNPRTAAQNAIQPKG